MTDYTSWYVGMKVVCVMAKPARAPVDAQYPAVNQIYTIREIRDDARWGGKSIVVLLAELDNRHFIGRIEPDGTYYVEPGFSLHGFRPVQTRKTDISIFTAMLNPLTTRETA